MTPRVAVVYHFFPHYRSAIVRELARSDKFSWAFYSDAEDFDSDIKPMEFPPSVRFHRLPVHRLYKSIMWQSGVVRLAASRDCDVLILLGVSKYLSMWPAAVIGRLTGKRVLFWTHGWGLGNWTCRPTQSAMNWSLFWTRGAMYLPQQVRERMATWGNGCGWSTRTGKAAYPRGCVCCVRPVAWCG